MMHTRIYSAVLASTLAAVGCNNDTTRAGAPVGVQTGAVQGSVTTSMVATGGVTMGHHVDNHAPGAAMDTDATHTSTVLDDREAEAEFKSVPKMKLEGDAELDEVPTGVRVVVEVEKAPPGIKGIHIHETDDCSDIAKKSMGGHFAPTIPKHGLPEAPEHHLGDLGNITIDKDGNGKLDFIVVGANLKPNDPLSFIGKSIVIHEANDKGTGEAGDAGKPIACAPIKAD